MKVKSVTITSRGRGWHDEPPIVSLHGGGGTGADCRARVVAGQVVAVDVLDGGVNYASPPEVRFSGGGKCVGTATEAHAELAEGGTPFADQPTPKPENPPKPAKGTPPVRANTTTPTSRPASQGSAPLPLPTPRPPQ